MSTYINPDTLKPFRIDTLEAPNFLKEYLNYALVVENLAERTVNNYYIQLRIFLRWVTMKKTEKIMNKEQLKEAPVSNLSLSDIKDLTPTDIHEYLSFTSSVLKNSATSRSLKLTAVKALYEYYFKVKKEIESNPAEDIPSPKLPKQMPKYLTEDESITLLSSVSGDQEARDYLIITLLVNCGMRLSELVGIDTDDIKDDTIRLYGKGRKERIIYMNNACRDALSDYMEQRSKIKNSHKTKALLLSSKTGNRLTGRRVEQIVKNILNEAGLSGNGISPHKLRHTAATLLYKSDNVNVLELKEILGHENIATTEIYTHLDQEQVRNAMQKSPLANIKREKEK